MNVDYPRIYGAYNHIVSIRTSIRKHARPSALRSTLLKTLHRTGWMAGAPQGDVKTPGDSSFRQKRWSTSARAVTRESTLQNQAYHHSPYRSVGCERRRGAKPDRKSPGHLHTDKLPGSPGPAILARARRIRCARATEGYEIAEGNNSPVVAD